MLYNTNAEQGSTTLDSASSGSGKADGQAAQEEPGEPECSVRRSEVLVVASGALALTGRTQLVRGSAPRRQCVKMRKLSAGRLESPECGCGWATVEVGWHWRAHPGC